VDDNMRDVQVIKDKRNQLRDELVKFTAVKEDAFPKGTRYSELSDYDRQLYNYTMGCINSLRNQINALEYVLNEDTELNDNTRPYPSQVSFGITKESVFKMSNDTEIANRTFYS
jgi:hypothetical protein